MLIIEVAETSAAYDREVKIPLYGRHGVGEAWLIDLETGQVEVFRQPGPDGYGDWQVFRGFELVSPLALPDHSFTVNEILGG